MSLPAGEESDAQRFKAYPHWPVSHAAPPILTLILAINIQSISFAVRPPLPKSWTNPVLSKYIFRAPPIRFTFNPGSS